jgi:hypothetical protein
MLHVAKDLTLGLDAVTKTIAILAQRGMGKSYCASVLTEQMLKAGAHVVVVDPLGVFWGLRSSEDGRHEGLPIPIFGGDHADVPLDPNSGTLVADLVVNERLSVVLDLSRMSSSSDAARFMLAFSERLYHKNRKPLHLILDEADEWAPQHPMHGKERLLGAIENLVRRGRARGLGVTLVTQRSAVLNKNVLSQADLLIAMRTVAPQDRAAIDAWVKANGDEAGRRQVMDSLASLAIGEAWFWSPGWLGSLKRSKVNRRETFDSSATPKMGVRVREPKTLSTVDLDRIKDQMATTIAQAKQEDPRELRATIAQLKNELRLSQLKVDLWRSKENGVQEKVLREKIIERKVPWLDRKAMGAMTELAMRVRLLTKNFHELGETLKGGVFKELVMRVESAADRVDEPIRQAVKAAERGGVSVGFKPVLKGPQQPKPDPHKHPSYPGFEIKEKRPENLTIPVMKAPQEDERSLKAGAIAMLGTLSQFHPTRLTRLQLATLTGFAESGGTFNTYLGRLRRLQLVDEAGDTIGIVAWPDWIPVSPRKDLTPEAVLQLWRGQFKSGVVNMLDVLLEHREVGLTRERLGKLTEFTHTGGTFLTYLSTLKRNGLVTEHGDTVKISDALFMGVR